MINAIDHIQNLPKFTYPLGNKQLKKLLSLLGNPEKSLKFIHIAGTNGKGSAAAMLGSILSESGYRTGVFTSPYIIKFNERIRIGNSEIPDEALLKHAKILDDTCRKNDIVLSQFAFIVALAFCYYKEENCDIVVLEAGLGGRLDATNVIENPLVSVIMSIGLDHTEYLGSALSEIAREKGGIIKENGDVAVYRSGEEVLAVFSEICKRLNAKLHIADDSISVSDGFLCNGKAYKLALSGAYQAQNAAVVLKTAEILRGKGLLISEEALERGFMSARHRARFERVRENVIVDGAHNPDGIDALCKALESEKKEKTAVMAMMEDKAVDDVLERLVGFSEIIVTEIAMPRCMKAELLAKKATEKGHRVRIIKSPEEAFKIAEKSDFAVVCGSIYLAGEALRYFDLA